MPGRWTVAVPGNDLGNPPELRNPSTLWGFLDVYLQAAGQWIMQVFSPSGTSEDAGYVYVRKNINSAGWTNWYRFATSTPPQEYDLPLTDGIVNNNLTKSIYFMDQFGIVTVSIQVHGTSAVSPGTTIAQLPQGFRPKTPKLVYAATGVYLAIDPDGNINMYGQVLEPDQWLAANVSFEV